MSTAGERTTVPSSDQLDAEMAARGAEQAEEPELPAPRADGVLAGLAPDAMAGSL